MVTEYIGTPAGVREICRNLNIPEVPDNDCIEHLKYGFGQLLIAINKTEWDTTEPIYGFAQKVNEEYAAVNIAFRTNLPVDVIALIRKMADQDLERLIKADQSLLTSTETGSTPQAKHGGIREYNYWTNNDEKDHYRTPEMN